MPLTAEQLRAFDEMSEEELAQFSTQELSYIQSQLQESDKTPGIIDRALISFGGGPQATPRALSIARNRGFNAVPMGNGEIGINSGGRVKPLDPPGMSLSDLPGDMADLSREALIGATSAGGATIGSGAGFGGTTVGAAGGAQAGSYLSDLIARLAEGGGELGGPQGGNEQTERFGPLAPNPAMREAQLGAMGEMPARLLGALGFKAMNPFQSGRTEFIRENVEKVAKELGIPLEKLPIASRTGSPFAGALHVLLETSPATAVRFNKLVQEPFDEVRDNLLKDMTERLGPDVDLTDLENMLLGARQEKISATREMVGGAFDEVDALLPNDSRVELIHLPDQIRESMQFTGAGRLRTSEDILPGLQSIIDDLETVSNMGDLRALRSNISRMNREGKLGAQGNRILEALDNDLEEMFDLQRPVVRGDGGQFRQPTDIETSQHTQEVSDKFREAMRKAKIDFTKRDNSTTRLVFEGRGGENISDAVRKVFKRNNTRGAREFLTDIGAYADAELGLPASEAGEKARKAIQVIFLNDAITAATNKHGNMDFATFYDVLFGRRGPGMEILQTLFEPDELERVATVSKFLKESDITSRSQFRINTNPVRAELVLMMFNPLRYLANVFVPEQTVGRFAISKPGRSFLTEQTGSKQTFDNLARIPTLMGMRGTVDAFDK